MLEIHHPYFVHKQYRKKAEERKKESLQATGCDYIERHFKECPVFRAQLQTSVVLSLWMQKPTVPYPPSCVVPCVNSYSGQV